MTTSRVELRWRATPHARRMLTFTLLALLFGLAFGRPGLVALAAVPAAYLAARPVTRARSAALTRVVGAETSFEDEPVPVEVRVSLDRPVELASVTVRSPLWVRCTAPRQDRADVDAVDCAGEVVVTRWGRRRLGEALVALTDDSALYRADVTVDLGELPVFPQPHPVQRLALAPFRLGLTGDHRSRRSGPGAEFAGVRRFGPGDSPARVNWPVSMRTQRLHVTERIAEQAVDVVLVIDTFSDVGPPGRSSRDLSVRGASGLAHALLRSHDRVGVVALGGWIRWLRPDSGTRQFYRVAAAMLDVIDRESYVDPDIDMLPPRAVPAGAHVIVFSPLLDLRVLPVLEALRLRGVSITVVDVLTALPPCDDETERLARRLWLLERRALVGRLAGLGVLVATWQGDAPLAEQVLPALARRPLAVPR